MQPKKEISHNNSLEHEVSDLAVEEEQERYEEEEEEEEDEDRPTNTIVNKRKFIVDEREMERKRVHEVHARFHHEGFVVLFSS